MRGIDLVMEKLAFLGAARPPQITGRKSVGIGPINTGAAAARAPRSSGISYTARGPARAPAVVKTKFDPSKLRNPYG